MSEEDGVSLTSAPHPVGPPYRWYHALWRWIRWHPLNPWKPWVYVKFQIVKHEVIGPCSHPTGEHRWLEGTNSWKCEHCEKVISNDISAKPADRST